MVVTNKRKNLTVYEYDRSKIRLIEDNAKCRHLKKMTCKETLRQVFICLRPKTTYPPTHCILVYSIHIHTGKGKG
jgi:hypothetical protein